MGESDHDRSTRKRRGGYVFVELDTFLCFTFSLSWVFALTKHFRNVLRYTGNLDKHSPVSRAEFRVLFRMF